VKVFFDTEFTGLHQNTTLISIGFVAENEQEFYAEFTDYNKEQVNDWIQQNVLNNLILLDMVKRGETKNIQFNNKGTELYFGEKQYFKKHFNRWIAQFDTVEMWSDVLAYDWVLFCDLFGNAFCLPENIYYIPFDLATLLKINDINPDINREEFSEMLQYFTYKKHNALWDARVIKACYEKLMRLGNGH
jgi:hypothetical protein